MNKEFIITIFSENTVGLLSQITTVFTHRNVNIESITASESAIDGIYKHTILVRNDEDKVANLVKQIEKKMDVEDLVRRHNVRILDIHDDYIVLEKTGHRDEIRELYKMLSPYGVSQFVCSGQVAIIKSRSELLDEYLAFVNERQRQLSEI